MYVEAWAGEGRLRTALVPGGAELLIPLGLTAVRWRLLGVGDVSLGSNASEDPSSPLSSTRGLFFNARFLPDDFSTGVSFIVALSFPFADPSSLPKSPLSPSVVFSADSVLHFPGVLATGLFLTTLCAVGVGLPLIAIP